MITVQPGRDLWLLRHPRPSDRAPEHVALLQEPVESPVELEPNTRVIDLLDDDVDLSPDDARGTDGRAFVEARAKYAMPEPPELHDRVLPPMTTIGELLRSAPGEHVVTSPTGATYSIDPRRLDPDYFTGVLRAAFARTPTGSTRLDVRRTQVPSLPLDEQRRYGQAFAQLRALEEKPGQRGRAHPPRLRGPARRPDRSGVSVRLRQC